MKTRETNKNNIFYEQCIEKINLKEKCNFCPICLQILKELKPIRVKDRKNEMIKNYYTGYDETVQCVGKDCNVKVHKMCLNKNSKKDKSRNFKCLYCSENKNEEQKCIVCETSYGMKTVIVFNKKNYYGHLICLFFNPNFFIEDFQTLKFAPYNRSFFEQLYKREKNNTVCYICVGSIYDNDSYFGCKECNQKAHINCVFFVEMAILNVYDVDDGSLDLDKANNPIAKMEIFDVQQQIFSDFDEEAVSKMLNICPPLRKLKEKLKNNNKEAITMLTEKLKKLNLSAPNFVFQMICTDCKKNKSCYCCNSTKVNETMTECDICNTWVHTTCDFINFEIPIDSPEKNIKTNKNPNKKTPSEKNESKIEYFNACKNCSNPPVYLKNKAIENNPRNFKTFWLFYIEILNNFNENNFDSFSVFSNKVFFNEKQFVLEKAIMDNFDDFTMLGKIKELGLRFEELIKNTNLTCNEAFDNIKEIILVYEKEIIKTVKKSENTNEESYYLVKMLNELIPVLKSFLEKPIHKFLVKLKNILSKNLMRNRFKNKNIFIKNLVNFIQRFFIYPISQVTQKIKEIFEYNKIKNHNNYKFEAENKKKEMEEFIFNNVSESVFFSQISELQKIKICQSFLEQKINTKEYYEIVGNFSKNFRELSAEEIHKTFHNLTKYIFCPAENLHQNIKVFLKNYFVFVEEEKCFIKYYYNFKKCAKMAKMTTKKFFSDKKNLKRIITVENLEQLQKCENFNSLLEYYFEKKNLEEIKNNLHLLEIEKKVDDFDDSGKDNLKKCRKLIVSKILENKLIITKKIKSFIKPIYHQYEIKTLLKKIKDKDYYLEEIKQKIKMIKKENVSGYVHSQIWDIIKEGDNFEEKYLKKYQNGDSIREFVENYKEILKKANKEDVKFWLIESFKKNLEFFKELNSVIEKDKKKCEEYEIDDNGVLEKIKNFDVDKIMGFIKENMNFENLERLKNLKIENFVIKDLRKMFEMIQQTYFQKLFEEGKEGSKPKPRIKISIFKTSSIISYLQSHPVLRTNFNSNLENFRKFERKLEDFCNLVYENYNLPENNIDEIFETIKDILKLSDSYIVDIPHYQDFLNYLYIYRFSIFFILNCQRFFEEIKTLNGREFILKNKSTIDFIHEFIYKKNLLLKKNNSIWQLNNFRMELSFNLFFENYKDIINIEIKLKKYEYLFKARTKENLEKLTDRKNLIEDKEAVELLEKLEKYEIMYEKEITTLNTLLNETDFLARETEDKIEEYLKNNLSYLLSKKEEIDNYFKRLNRCSITNEDIKINQKFFLNILDYMNSNGKSYEEYYDNYSNLKTNLIDFNEKESILFQDILKKHETILNVNKNMKRIQENKENKSEFELILKIIKDFSDISDFKICFNFDSFEEFHEVIEICTELLVGDFSNYFKKYFKLDNNNKKISKIVIPDELEEEIGKISKKATLLENFVEAKKNEMKKSLESIFEDKINVGFYLYIKKFTFEQIQIYKNPEIKTFYKEIAKSRSSYQKTNQNVENLIKKLCLKICELTKKLMNKKNEKVFNNDKIVYEIVEKNNETKNLDILNEAPFFDFYGVYLSNMEKLILATNLWLIDCLKQIIMYFHENKNDFSDLFSKNNYFEILLNLYNVDFNEKIEMKLKKKISINLNYLFSFVLTITKSETKNEINEKVKKIIDSSKLLIKTFHNESDYYAETKNQNSKNIFKNLNFFNTELKSIEDCYLKNFENFMEKKKIKKEQKASILKKLQKIIDKICKDNNDHFNNNLQECLNRKFFKPLLEYFKDIPPKTKKKTEKRFLNFFNDILQKPALKHKFIQKKFKFSFIWREFESHNDNEEVNESSMNLRKRSSTQFEKTQKKFNNKESKDKGKMETYKEDLIENKTDFKEISKLNKSLGENNISNKQRIEETLQKLKTETLIQDSNFFNCYNEYYRNSIFSLKNVSLTYSNKKIGVKLLLSHQPIAFNFLKNFSVVIKFEKIKKFSDQFEKFENLLNNRMKSLDLKDITIGWFGNELEKEDEFFKNLQNLEKNQCYTEIFLCEKVGYEMYIGRYIELTDSLKNFMNYQILKNQHSIDYNNIFVFVIKINKEDNCSDNIEDNNMYLTEDSFHGNYEDISITNHNLMNTFISFNKIKDPDVCFE